MRMIVPMLVLGGMLLFDSRILVVLVFALRIEPVFPTICTSIEQTRCVKKSRSELLLTLERLEQLLVLLFGFTLRVHDLAREGHIGTHSFVDRWRDLPSPTEPIRNRSTEPRSRFS